MKLDWSLVRRHPFIFAADVCLTFSTSYILGKLFGPVGLVVSLYLTLPIAIVVTWLIVRIER